MNKQNREGEGKAPPVPFIPSDMFRSVPNKGFGDEVSKPKK